MRISDVQCGQWFIYQDEPFMKVDSFLRGTGIYQAISLLDGRPAFSAPTGSYSPPHFSDTHIKVIDKPQWTRPQNQFLYPD